MSHNLAPIITGAVLFDRARGAVVRCNLWRIGPVFVANCASRHGVAWSWDIPDEGDKVLEISPIAVVMEAGRTIAVHSDWAKLNDAALAYLGGTK